MPDMKSEIQRRRTFAIISHPDAGKTKKYPECPRLALAYSIQLEDSIPGELHDIRVELIITEKGMIRCLQDSREIR